MKKDLKKEAEEFFQSRGRANGEADQNADPSEQQQDQEHSNRNHNERRRNRDPPRPSNGESGGEKRAIDTKLGQSLDALIKAKPNRNDKNEANAKKGNDKSSHRASDEDKGNSNERKSDRGRREESRGGKGAARGDRANHIRPPGPPPIPPEVEFPHLFFPAPQPLLPSLLSEPFSQPGFGLPSGSLFPSTLLPLPMDIGGGGGRTGGLRASRGRGRGRGPGPRPRSIFEPANYDFNHAMNQDGTGDEPKDHENDSKLPFGGSSLRLTEHEGPARDQKGLRGKAVALGPPDVPNRDNDRPRPNADQPPRGQRVPGDSGGGGGGGGGGERKRLRSPPPSGGDGYERDRYDRRPAPAAAAAAGSILPPVERDLPLPRPRERERERERERSPPPERDRPPASLPPLLPTDRSQRSQDRWGRDEEGVRGGVRRNDPPYPRAYARDDYPPTAAAAATGGSDRYRYAREPIDGYSRPPRYREDPSARYLRGYEPHVEDPYESRMAEARPRYAPPSPRYNRAPEEHRPSSATHRYGGYAYRYSEYPEDDQDADVVSPPPRRGHGPASAAYQTLVPAPRRERQGRSRSELRDDDFDADTRTMVSRLDDRQPAPAAFAAAADPEPDLKINKEALDKLFDKGELSQSEYDIIMQGLIPISLRDKLLLLMRRYGLDE